MRLVKSSFEIIEQQSGEVGMLKHIETCGRVAWKSEERITDDSHISFVNMLKGVNHGSVLEHGTVYLKVSHELNSTILNAISFFSRNKYTKTVFKDYDNFAYITTNYRVIIDENYNWILKYQCEPTEFHEKRYTVRFICDRGVSHEYVRHRTFSFTQESTRYCNYTKDKFSNELTYIQPCWLEDMNTRVHDVLLYKDSLKYIEHRYFELINEGWKPQQARSILPNSLKTELIMTGFVSDWKHFIDLRSNGTTGAPHPDMKKVADMLKDEFIELKYYDR